MPGPQIDNAESTEQAEDFDVEALASIDPNEVSEETEIQSQEEPTPDPVLERLDALQKQNAEMQNQILQMQPKDEVPEGQQKETGLLAGLDQSVAALKYESVKVFESAQDVLDTIQNPDELNLRLNSLVEGAVRQAVGEATRLSVSSMPSVVQAGIDDHSSRAAALQQFQDKHGDLVKVLEEVPEAGELFRQLTASVRSKNNDKSFSDVLEIAAAGFMKVVNKEEKKRSPSAAGPSKGPGGSTPTKQSTNQKPQTDIEALVAEAAAKHKKRLGL